jgi:uracil-DNA glycosylase
MEEYLFGYPEQCTKCAAKGELRLLVAPYFREGNDLRLMLIGQDPTIRREPERVKCVLMLDQKNGQLSRWLRGLFGADNFDSLTLYATNLVKCSFSAPPSTAKQGGLRFLRPYFENCKAYLVQEISHFRPTFVLSLGEPTHKLFITILDNGNGIGDSMQTAFTGNFVRARLRGVEFDYSPCLHIQTFRVAEVYGDCVKRFKAGIAAYFKESRAGGAV